MNLVAKLSKGLVVAAAVAAVGGTVALTGAALSGPAGAASTVDTSSKSAYISSVAPLAQAAQKKYKVPASVAIAQSILESDWGTSGLTKKGNAYFGIKCSSNKGPYASGCINMQTTEYDNGTYQTTAGFRTYKSAQDSFYDHGWFLTNNSRYSKAFNYPNDAKQFIAEVAKAGYATDPTYTSMIVDLMDDYNLYRYDKSTAAKPSPSQTVPTKTVTTSATPRPTASATPSASATATPSSTRTATPSTSATPGRSASPRAATATPTPTPTPTPSASPTPTRSMNPAAVRAEQPQDPAKAGALAAAPKAAPKVGSASSASSQEGEGGLAKTGR